MTLIGSGHSTHDHPETGRLKRLRSGNEKSSIDFHEGMDLMAKSARLLTLCVIGAAVIGTTTAGQQRASAAASAADKRASAAAVFFDKGVELLNKGDYKLSSKAFADAIKVDPKAAGARINLGVVLCSMHDYVNAMRELNEALKLYPNNAYALSQRALCKQGLKDYAGSLADFNRAYAMNPKSATVLSNRGVSKLESGDYQGARADFKAALKLAPGDADVLNNLKVLDHGKANGELSIQAAVKQALNTMGVLDIDGNSSLHNLEVKADVEQKPPLKAAGQNYEVPLADIVDPHYYVACQLISATKYAEAIRELDQVVTHRRDGEFYYCRAAAYNKLGNFKLALADCSSAIELDPKDPNAFINRCSAYADLGDGAAALRDADQAVLLNSEAADDRKVHSSQGLYLNRGRAHLLLRDFANAVVDFNKAIEIDPKNAMAFHSRAIAHLESEDHKQAVADFLQAARLYGDQGNAKAAADCTTEAEQLSAKDQS